MFVGSCAVGRGFSIAPSIPSMRGDPRPNPHSMARRASKLHLSPRGQRWCPNCGRCAPGRHEALGPAPTGSAMGSDQFHLFYVFVSLTSDTRGKSWGEVGAPRKLPTPAGGALFLGTPVPRWPSPEPVPPALCVGVRGTRCLPAPEDPPRTPGDKQPASVGSWGRGVVGIVFLKTRAGK